MNIRQTFNRLRAVIAGVPLCLGALGTVATVNAQQPQIPTLQVCNVPTVVQGAGTVTIVARQGPGLSGSFTVQVSLQCDLNTGYPIGSLTISGISMTDSAIQGTVVATTFEQLTSTGRVTPTAFLNGRCSADSPAGAAPIQGCRYWIMFANNNGATPAAGTADVVGFLIMNKAGQRVAYGTGPVVHGHINVAPTPF
jgi:hypothetical protein